MIVLVAMRLTVWPATMLVLSMMMSALEVATVRAEIQVVPAESVIMARAAVPVASADVSLLGRPENVSTPLDTVPQGRARVIWARTVPVLVVILRMPAVEVPSIELATAVMRADFTAVE